MCILLLVSIKYLHAFSAYGKRQIRCAGVLILVLSENYVEKVWSKPPRENIHR